MEADRILRTGESAAKLGVSRATLYVWVKQGLLQPPLRIGPRASGWRESTLDAFIARREQEVA